MKKNLALVCLPLFVYASVCAQDLSTDSIKTLKEVLVSGKRDFVFGTGIKSELYDSVTLRMYRFLSMTDLLSAQNQMFLKSYGPGSLTTTSFRGGSAAHTAVLWNGLNIQSPLTGQLDFSLIQNDLMDEVNVKYGGSGALFGSGAIGGVIALNNKPSFNNGLHASLTSQMGSFGFIKETGTFSLGTQNSYTSIKVFNVNSKNDFPFVNSYLPGSPEVRQTHAEYKLFGVMADQYFKLSISQQFGFHFWVQSADRNIPPTMSVPLSVAKQDDLNVRFSGQWSVIKKKYTLVMRSAWFTDKLIYGDSSSGINSLNRSQTFINEAEFKVYPGMNQWLNLGVNSTLFNADCDAFLHSVSEVHSSVFASYKVQNNKKNLNTAFNLRQELINNQLLPLNPSIGVDWVISHFLHMYANINRSYRYPTLNERYWNPGGDINLRPEQGWGQEVSSEFNAKSGFLKTILVCSIFNRNITDWIQWIPSGSYWRPQNLLEVWSRGMEMKMTTVLIQRKEFSLIYDGRLNDIISTIEKTASTGDGTLHQQLMYVPKLNYLNQFTITLKRFYFRISQTYNGIRFTQNDDSKWLMYYLIGNVAAGNEFVFGSFVLDLSAHFNNIWNESYQVMENRPMPGQNVMLSLTIKY